MPFEDNPLESSESYPCECGGEISLNDDDCWECDSCDFFYDPDAEEEE